MVSFPLFSSSQISNDPVHNKIPGKSDPCPQGSKLGNFRLMNFTYAHMLLPEPRSFHRTKICCTASRPRLITRRSIISAGSSLKTSSGVFKGKSCEGGRLITSDPPPPFRWGTLEALGPTENDKDSPSEGISSLAGGIVALGKFDALHIGHRELAIQAAKIGVPFLLSFIGMAEILGWEPRAPIVAKCDRKRVLSSWAPFCSNVIPKEFHIEFSKVRHLTPQQFVEKLSKELGVGGVVAGQNYRFGYRAAGDSSDLVQLCQEYGMEAFIVHSVMDMKNQQEAKDIIGCKNSTEQGQVSSTRIRHALGIGDVDYVSELLGRHHRLILMVHKSKQESLQDGNKLSAPRSCLLNIPPKGGLYEKCSLVMGDDNVLVPCRVVIDATDIHVEFDQLDPHMTITAQSFEFLGIDFGYSRV